MQFQRKPLETVHKNVVHNRCSPAALFTRVHEWFVHSLKLANHFCSPPLFTKGVCSQKAFVHKISGIKLQHGVITT
eukprot:scaffold33275_cov76-Phaeocystis_antarctica.AAC.11